MKVSLPITLLILVAAAVIGWRNERQIAELRDESERLTMHPASGEFATGVHELGARTGRESWKTERVAEARRVAGDFMAYAVEMDALGVHGGYPEDDAIRRRIIAQMEAVMALDAEQWKVVIDEVAGRPGLPNRVRNRLLDFAIERLIEAAPGEALVQLVDTPGRLELLEELANNFAMNAVRRAMQSWGRDDPAAALAWFEQNKGRLPEDLAEKARSALLRGTATSDPRHALELVEELGEDPQQWLEPIARAAEGAEGRRAALSAIRDWCAESESPPSEDVGDAFQVLAFDNRFQSRRFEEAAAWIDQSRFTTEELDLLTRDIERFVRIDETGKWIEWLGESLPEDTVADRVEPLMDRWARRDYPAAGEWLATASPGPVRETTILTYAAAIFPHDSEAALEWARTLPDGEERLRALQRAARSFLP